MTSNLLNNQVTGLAALPFTSSSFRDLNRLLSPK